MMKRIIFICILFNFVLIGCTSYHIVNHSPYAYNRLNDRFKNKQGYITLSNGQHRSATEIQVDIDSTKWVDATTQKYQSISTLEIDEIVIDRDLRNKTYRIGASVLGGAFGGAFGGLIIWSAFAGETSGIDYYSKVGCLYGSMAGGLFGFVYEAIGGTTHRYTIKGNETLPGDSVVDRQENPSRNR